MEEGGGLEGWLGGLCLGGGGGGDRHCMRKVSSEDTVFAVFVN